MLSGRVCVLQKGGSSEQEFSDVAKYSYEQLTDKDNPPEGVDMQRKEVRTSTSTST